MTNSDVLEPDCRTRHGGLIRWGPAGILGKWFGHLISRLVPVGYEDKSGFHYGMQPAATETASQCMFKADRIECSPRPA